MWKWIGVGLGLTACTAAALVHGVTATAAPSMLVLGILWLFVPAPLVFLWRVFRRPSGVLRGLASAYVAVSVLMAVAVLGLVGWIGSERGIHPAPCETLPRIEEYPAVQQGMQRVTFPSREGTQRVGWFVPGSNGATVVLLHGYRCDKREMLPHASFLHDAGYSVLLFDFRNRGESAGDAVTLGYYERQDALGAVDYLKTRGDVDAKRIGVLGVSMGGATAVLAAAVGPDLRAVVTESAFRTADSSIEEAFTHFIHLPRFPYAPITTQIIQWRLGVKTSAVSPQRDIARISPRPVFIIHGLADETISPDNARDLYAAAGQPKELWLVPGSGHAHAVDVAHDEYVRRVTRFFDNNLGVVK